jgi:hypothetical protein
MVGHMTPARRDPCCRRSSRPCSQFHLLSLSSPKSRHWHAASHPYSLPVEASELPADAVEELDRIAAR